MLPYMVRYNRGWGSRNTLLTYREQNLGRVNETQGQKRKLVLSEEFSVADKKAKIGGSVNPDLNTPSLVDQLEGANMAKVEAELRAANVGSDAVPSIASDATFVPVPLRPVDSTVLVSVAPDAVLSTTVSSALALATFGNLGVNTALQGGALTGAPSTHLDGFGPRTPAVPDMSSMPKVETDESGSLLSLDVAGSSTAAAGSMIAAGGLNGNAAGSVVAPVRKKRVKAPAAALTISTTLLSARNLAKKKFLESHPGATVGQFDKYWGDLVTSGPVAMAAGICGREQAVEQGEEGKGTSEGCKWYTACFSSEYYLRTCLPILAMKDKGQRATKKGLWLAQCGTSIYFDVRYRRRLGQQRLEEMQDVNAFVWMMGLMEIFDKLCGVHPGADMRVWWSECGVIPIFGLGAICPYLVQAILQNFGLGAIWVFTV
ncbi:hypothetical protein FB451DRAFT_1175115 [Mycena latifolia]|nr:hypothetical protein FB451DRAFT_1175115 [Mycena latifolia]